MSLWTSAFWKILTTNQNLKTKTGLDPEVQEFIKQSPFAMEFLQKFTDMVVYLIPKYIKEGKSYLTIAVGCSGGKHRSVFMAHSLAETLRTKTLKFRNFIATLK